MIRAYLAAPRRVGGWGVGRHWYLTGALLAAGAAGYMGADLPLGVVAASGVLLALGVGAYALAQPGRGLVLASWLVLLAGTKFRQRPATDSLAGLIDGQIIMELALYALIGVAALAALAGRVGRSSLRSSDGLLVVYCAMAAISVLWSSNPQITAVRSSQLVVVLLLGYASMLVLGPVKALGWLTASLAGYVLLGALLAVTVPGASGTTVGYLGVSRFSWFSVHPVTAGTYAALAVILVLAGGLFSAPSRGVARWLGWMAVRLVPLGVILLATRSRGATLACAVAVLCIMLRRFVRPWIIPLGVATILVTGLVFVNSGVTLGKAIREGAQSRNPVVAFMYRGQSAEKFESFSQRTELWEGVAELIRQRPLLGLGYQGSRRYVLDVLSWAGHAHNALVQSVLDLGILGATFLWVAVVRALIRVCVGPSRPGSSTSWLRAIIFGAVLLLLVDSVVDESFAGPPGFDVLVLFTCIMAADRLRSMQPSS